MGGEDLGDRAAADRREEHQRVPGLDLAEVLVGDPLHTAADLDQRRGQLGGLARDDRRAAIGRVLPVAAQRADEHEADRPDDDRDQEDEYERAPAVAVLAVAAVTAAEPAPEA